MPGGGGACSCASNAGSEELLPLLHGPLPSTPDEATKGGGWVRHYTAPRTHTYKVRSSRQAFPVA